MTYIRSLLKSYNCSLLSTCRDGFYYSTPTRNKVFMSYEEVEHKEYSEEDFE